MYFAPSPCCSPATLPWCICHDRRINVAMLQSAEVQTSFGFAEFSRFPCSSLTRKAALHLLVWSPEAPSGGVSPGSLFWVAPQSEGRWAGTLQTGPPWGFI